MLLHKDTVVLVIRIMQPLKSKILSLSNHIRETNSIGTNIKDIPIQLNNHHLLLPSFTREAVANLDLKAQEDLNQLIQK